MPLPASYDTDYDTLVQFGASRDIDILTEPAFYIGYCIYTQIPDRPDDYGAAEFDCNTWFSILSARTAIMRAVENDLNDNNKLVIYSGHRAGAVIHTLTDLSQQGGNSRSFHCAIGHWPEPGQPSSTRSWQPAWNLVHTYHISFDRQLSEISSFVNAMIELLHLYHWHRPATFRRAFRALRAHGPVLQIPPPLELFDPSLHCLHYFELLVYLRGVVLRRVAECNEALANNAAAAAPNPAPNPAPDPA